MDTTANDGNLSGRIRFNLRTLLVGFALLSIPLTLLHWLGPWFLVPIVLSTGLVVVCCCVYRVDSPKHSMTVAGLAFPLSLVVAVSHTMFTFSLGGSGTLILHTLINFGICLAAVLVHSPRKALTVTLSLAAIATYYAKISELQELQRRFDRMLADHPLESLEDRLAFESDERIRQSADTYEVSLSQLSPTVSQNLAEQEQRYDRQREWALGQLHENYSRQFARAAGFGNMRMGSIRPEYLEPEPVELIQLPLPIGGRLLDETPSVEAGKLHRLVTYDVLNRDKIGYARDKQHVAGFQSHSPTNLTETIDNKRSCGDDTVEDSFWQLTRLELVSLLRHPTPRVYVSDSLPAMDQLDEFEHRALTEFEQNSLKKLRAEQDVAVSSEADQILMVGALRASQDCLTCHQGSEGTMLGAFSYEFTRLDSDQPMANEVVRANPFDGFQATANLP